MVEFIFLFLNGIIRSAINAEESMKKLALFILAALLPVISACGSMPANVGTGMTPSASLVQEDDVAQPPAPEIGVSLAGESGFYDQLIAALEAACAPLGYSFEAVAADSAEKQNSDILAMLNAGVKVIVIDPVDVDELESVLSECESESVPVINILDAINGTVSTLIAPDYTKIGDAAGARASALLEDGGRCLELKTDCGSFIMQMMSDGFDNAAKEMTLTEKFCGDDETAAYEAVQNKLASDEVGFIFAQSPKLAHGAIRAVNESGKTVSLAVYGADRTIMEGVSSGIVDTALFVDAVQTAKYIVADADGFIRSAAYAPPQYRELTVFAVTADNLAEYYAAGDPYAKAPVR